MRHYLIVGESKSRCLKGREKKKERKRKRKEKEKKKKRKRKRKRKRKEKEKKKTMEKQVEKLTLEQENEYTLHRIALFDKLKAEYDSIVHPEEPITVSLPTSQVQAISFKTTPLDIAKNISSSLAKRILISKVNGVLWDLLRPLESNCSLELLDFDHKDAKMVFWHSSAHVLGEACERHYACRLCIGPPIENGYYYEMGMDRAISQSDYPALNSLSKKICSEKQKFERLVMSKSDLLEMFKHNRFKVHIIQDKIPDGTFTTVYRCGPLIDLCYGPHIPDTGRIKSMMITKNSASYFLGDSKNESLQRIYGVSFPDQKLMDEHVKFLAEAALRDHRKIGQDQELFFFNELSPGSCFFLPHGTRIYNSLVALQRVCFFLSPFESFSFTPLLLLSLLSIIFIK